jgi:hypothetical protein
MMAQTDGTIKQKGAHVKIKKTKFMANGDTKVSTNFMSRQ